MSLVDLPVIGLDGVSFIQHHFCENALCLNFPTIFDREGVEEVLHRVSDLKQIEGFYLCTGTYKATREYLDNELYYTYRVYKEAIVIPENIDAIRALVGEIKDGRESIRMTDEALGIHHDFLNPDKE